MIKEDLVIVRKNMSNIRVRKIQDGNLIWCHEHDDGSRGMTNHIYIKMYDDPLDSIRRDYLSTGILNSSQVKKVINWFNS